MSFNIIPNTALGFGVILIITSACGSVERIPCHNAATAEFTKRQIIAANR